MDVHITTHVEAWPATLFCLSPKLIYRPSNKTPLNAYLELTIILTSLHRIEWAMFGGSAKATAHLIHQHCMIPRPLHSARSTGLHILVGEVWIPVTVRMGSSPNGIFTEWDLLRKILTPIFLQFTAPCS